jgi:hypothetical protein
MAGTIVAVEIDFHDGSGFQTLWYFSGRDPLTGTVDGARVQYFPGLMVPITFGATIHAEQYGVPLRGAANGGDIMFDIGEADYYRLAFGYHYQGHPARVYAGDMDDGFDGLELQYSGRVTDLKFPLDGVIRVQISTTDEGLMLDDPLVSDLYPETEAVENIRGKPRPEVRGTCKGIQPILLDNPNQIYQISRLPLVAVDAVRVGGILWNGPVGGTPSASQWSVNLAAGTLTLGSTTLGAEVRVDARGSPVTTAGLVRAIVSEAGAEIDEPALAALEAAAPWQIGWHTTTDPINRLDALDQIMASIGGWWSFNEFGMFTAGVIADPVATASLELDEVSISSMNLAGLLPPAWRIQVEYARNWTPLNNVLPGATDEERQAAAATGTIAPAYTNEAIKTAEPRAVDVPVIHSLVNTEADAIAIRQRLEAAWATPRRVYDVAAYAQCPQLYDTVHVSYRNLINSNFRVHSVLRSVGGGTNQMRLWGP